MDGEASASLRARWRLGFGAKIRAEQEVYLRADADSVQQASYAEICWYLRNTLLRDGDAMSMAHSLELRPMLLHHPLVEYGYALPAALKLQGRRAKIVLKRAVADLVPKEVLARPKRGFELPFSAWITGPLRTQVGDLLSSAVARELFERRYREKLVRQVVNGRSVPKAVWAWAVLLEWMRQGQYQL